MKPYLIGIDSGSTFCKAVLFDGENILSTRMIKSGWQPLETAKRLTDDLLNEKCISMEDCKIISTGYGRESISFAHKSMTEISAHSLGGIFLNPKVKGIIDIGGQDCKVIKIRAQKAVTFFMNDKCAAGTGRFLDMACQTLDIPIADLDLFVATENFVTINSMCTVFAESEIIGLIAASVDRELILNGVLHSIAARISQMLSRLQPDKDDLFLMTGGLSQSKSMVDVLSSVTGYGIETHPNSCFAGAIGACLHGMKE